MLTKFQSLYESNFRLYTKLPYFIYIVLAFKMGVTNQFRCGWHCINLDAGEGRCNAIMYNRESKVMFCKTRKSAKLPWNHNFDIKYLTSSICYLESCIWYFGKGLFAIFNQQTSHNIRKCFNNLWINFTQWSLSGFPCWKLPTWKVALVTNKSYGVRVRKEWPRRLTKGVSYGGRIARGLPNRGHWLEGCLEQVETSISWT